MRDAYRMLPCPAPRAAAPKLTRVPGVVLLPQSLALHWARLHLAVRAVFEMSIIEDRGRETARTRRSDDHEKNHQHGALRDGTPVFAC